MNLLHYNYIPESTTKPMKLAQNSTTINLNIYPINH